MSCGNVTDINQLCTVRNMSDSPASCDPVNNVTFPFKNTGSRLLEGFIPGTPFLSMPLRSGVGTSKGPARVQRMGFQSETCPLVLNQKYLLRSCCALGAGDSAVNTAEPAPVILGQSSSDLGHPCPCLAPCSFCPGWGRACALQKHCLLSLESISLFIKSLPGRLMALIYGYGLFQTGSSDGGS